MKINCDHDKDQKGHIFPMRCREKYGKTRISKPLSNFESENYGTSINRISGHINLSVHSSKRRLHEPVGLCHMPQGSSDFDAQ